MWIEKCVLAICKAKFLVSQFNSKPVKVVDRDSQEACQISPLFGECLSQWRQKFLILQQFHYNLITALRVTKCSSFGEFTIQMLRNPPTLQLSCNEPKRLVM